MYLSQKKLPSSLIHEALEEIGDDDSFQAAHALMSHKLKSLKANSPYELYAKLMRFASSRGIEMEIAHKVIHELVNDIEE
jgi:SOS response regulatory protein OraA/RecX